jgi:Flp pilus assembly protein TadG
MIMIKKRCLGRFSCDQRGVSAVEFALLAPLMIGLYLGCAEISDGVAADRKVSLIAAAVANLTSQVSTISTSDMTNILAASSAIVVPYSSTNLKITVSCLNIDANKAVTTKWTATLNGGVGTTTSVPSALQVASSQLILSQVSYSYKPTVGYTITGTLTLTDHMFMSPRISAPTYNSTACS